MVLADKAAGAMRPSPRCSTAGAEERVEHSHEDGTAPRRRSATNPATIALSNAHNAEGPTGFPAGPDTESTLRRRLLGANFSRADARWINAALDYGYAVLRGAIARALVAHRLHPTVGLFHDSEQNAFNLTDDLIEPFRPLVVLHVARHAALTEGDLMPADKQALVALLNVDVAMPPGKMSALSAIEYAVESLVRVYEDDAKELDLPVLIGLRAHRLEY